MNFELKIQNISNIDSLTSNKLAITHSFEIDDPELLNKKGKLLAVLSIKTSENINLSSAVKVFLDTLRESFYRITDETPLSSLENAVSQALRMLYSVKTSTEDYTLGSKELHTEISLSTALIWNRVLYTNYYGGGIGYILRGSGIRDISAQNNNPNEIWTNSSILDNEDVIIIGTKEFAKTFPANTIIESFNEIPSLIAENSERNLISAVFIKLNSSKNEESSTSSNKGLFKNLANKGGLTEKVSMIKDLLSKTEKLSDRFKIYQKKKVAPIASISGIMATPQTGGNLKTGLTTSKRLNKERSKKSYKRIATTITGVFILGFISVGGYYAATAKNNSDQNNAQVLNYSTINPDALPEGSENKEDQKPTYTDIHKLIEIQKNINFVDFYVKNESTIDYISDKNGNLEEINLSTQKVTTLAEFDSPQFLRCDTKLCYLVDKQSLQVLEPKENPNIDKYLISNVGIINNIHPYNNRVYILSGSSIFQQQLLSSDSPTGWIQDGTTFSRPIDLAIDGNVYVLDGKNVVKLYAGRKIAEYDLSDRISEGSDIEVDIRNFYILDRQKRAILSFNKGTGEFVKEIALTDEFDPSIPEKIIAFEKTNVTTLYFLKNNKIFKVE